MDGQGWWYNNYRKCHNQVLTILIQRMSGYLGRGEPGATVKVHVHGVVIRDVGVDGARKLGNTYRKTARWTKNRSTTI